MARSLQFHCRIALALIALTLQASAAAKPHIISLGKWITVQWFPSAGSADEKPIPLKVRPLLLDARVKEFTFGPVHDVTDRLFVVRRAFRVNDSLPQESSSPPHWQWERGGWLLVDRVTGHVSSMNLPDFDVHYSDASWYRDYAAYCGISDDGKKIYGVVAQLSRRKPVLKKLFEGEKIAPAEKKDSAPDTACPAPAWQRLPARVTFEPSAGPKQTFAVRGHTVDLVVEEEPDEEEASK